MPNPANYKPSEKSKYLQDCMHTTKAEGKSHDQSVAQCLSIWKKDNDKDASEMVIKIAGKLQKAIDKAREQNDLPSVFLGGSCDDANFWRKEIKKEFGNSFFFIDPFDNEWEAEDNIYEELAALLNVDHVIFYKGGKGTEKEKQFMENTDKDYKAFDSMDVLKAHLKAIVPPALKKACISSLIRKLASRLLASKHSYSMLGIQVPTAIANKIKRRSKEVIPDSEIFPGEGREEDSHITLIYGLDSEDIDQVKKLLSNVEPFFVKLNKTSLFWDDIKYDVLKIDVNSPILQDLYTKLNEFFKPPKQHSNYNPHCTVAYLKKGYAEKYIDKDCCEYSFKVDSLVFYDNEDKKTHIKLGL